MRCWHVLEPLAKAHLLKGMSGDDATGMEANAAMKSVWRWKRGETHQEVLERRPNRPFFNGLLTAR